MGSKPLSSLSLREQDFRKHLLKGPIISKLKANCGVLKNNEKVSVLAPKSCQIMFLTSMIMCLFLFDHFLEGKAEIGKKNSFEIF
jgi:hypothetical protein